ncbi:MAG TPA: AEC family transporter [Patescibacteria group bacterium]|nr:AEC family transporter [Patescibacteria group bacterium]
MEIGLFIRTVFPILTLIALGYLGRRQGFLKKGDERVLSVYLYYFGLPALLLIDLSEIRIASETTMFLATSLLPMAIVFTVILAGKLLLGFSRDRFFLFLIVSGFGRLGFFEIPFISFAYPALEAERLATLSVSTISVAVFVITMTSLELHSLQSPSLREGLRRASSSLSRNPLIISLVTGLSLSLTSIRILQPLSDTLHMIGGSTTPIALFMLGVFLYGRKYEKIGESIAYLSIRAIVMPVLTFLVSRLVGHPIWRPPCWCSCTRLP